MKKCVSFPIPGVKNLYVYYQYIRIKRDVKDPGIDWGITIVKKLQV